VIGPCPRRDRDHRTHRPHPPSNADSTSPARPAHDLGGHSGNPPWAALCTAADRSAVDHASRSSGRPLHLTAGTIRAPGPRVSSSHRQCRRGRPAGAEALAATSRHHGATSNADDSRRPSRRNGWLVSSHAAAARQKIGCRAYMTRRAHTAAALNLPDPSSGHGDDTADETAPHAAVLISASWPRIDHDYVHVLGTLRPSRARLGRTPPEVIARAARTCATKRPR
jgi:hypothetical protein